jgi:1-acyl-sn-glycerol-3-phosphate acyltransferase
MFDNIYDLLLTIKAYIYLTFMLVVAFIGLILIILIYPLFYINTKYFRIISNNILNFIIPAFLAPISWNNFSIYITKSIENLKNDDSNKIIMSNHASRIDWIACLWYGYCCKQKKINYICESPHKYLPIVGWFRNFCEDIYVNRSFDKDKDNILNNINSFKETKTKRDIVFCPEGIIADNNEYDNTIIKDCNDFCKKNNLKKFKYVLTPRYKGLSCLIGKDTKYYSLTFAYVKNNKLMNCELKNKDRKVPDLIDILKDKIELYVYWDEIKFNLKKIKNQDDLNNLVKKKLLNSYKKHDKYLKNFDKYFKKYNITEFYRDQKNKEPFNKIPCETNMKSYYFFMILTSFYFYIKKYVSNDAFKKIVLFIFFTILFSHSGGKYISGYSRESIPFETALKAILYKDRDKNKKKFK